MTQIADFGMCGRLTTECLERVLRGYLACALWSSTDEEGQPLEYLNFSEDDLTDVARERAESEVCDFMDAAWDADLDLSPIEPEQMGHDFWLTRNHHGAGFWDRGLGDLGEKLTELAHAWGECDLYVTDDGLLEMT